MKHPPVNQPQPQEVDHRVMSGVRQANERTVKYLRHQLATWKKEDEAKGGRLAQFRAALFWSVNSRWATRIESVAAALEQEAVTLRNQEQVTARVENRPWLSRLIGG